MIYYSYDANTGLRTGQRFAQRDPVESANAGETVYMGPGINETTVEPPSVIPPQHARWTGTEWEVVTDYRGQEWYQDWWIKQPITEIGEPVGLYPTREDLPLENLRTFADRFVFNWSYFKKYGDNVDVVLDGVKLWSDQTSMQQAMLELAHAQTLEEYTNHEGWVGKEGGVINISSTADMARIVDAYRTHQQNVHIEYQAKKAAIAAATTKEELYDIISDIWAFLLSTGEFQDD